MVTFKRLSRADLTRIYPAKVPINDQTLSIAMRVVADLWDERCAERGSQRSADRSGSCKFAALIAREIFGGRLAGNDEHVFVLLAGRIIDLNRDQADVKALGTDAYRDNTLSLRHPDYLDALGSCVSRATKWAQIALEELYSEHLPPAPQYLVDDATVSP